MIIIIIFIALFILMFLYSILKISSENSKIQDNIEDLWQQQESGKYQKD